ncbi:MAG: hypothetical protein AAGF94_09560 [Pseudomonadota bacterium]
MISFDRIVDAGLLAELSKPVFYPAALVYVDWPSDPVRAHSGIGTISLAGQDWFGVGDLAGIQAPVEIIGLPPEKFEITLAKPIPARWASFRRACCRYLWGSASAFDRPLSQRLVV